MDAVTAARLIRRLDWRFLLPSPALKRVAYVGRRDSDLVRALQAHSDVVLCPAESNEDSPVDLVVAHAAAPREVAAACRLLSSTGSIYWELRARDRWRAAAERLAEAGIGDVTPHWHLRTFEDS